MKYSNIVLLYLEKKNPRFNSRKIFCKKQQLLPEAPSEGGITKRKKIVGFDLNEILLEIEEHNFDIDRIKGVEKSWIAGEGGGGGEEQKIRGQRLLREMRKRLARGFISSRLSGNRKRLRARKSFAELVGEISIRSKSMK